MVGGGLAFGVMGGLYGTVDWWRLKRQVKQERETLARLQAEIDSLAAWADLLEADSATQERVAREKFGMIRDGEMLYWVEGPER